MHPRNSQLQGVCDDETDAAVDRYRQLQKTGQDADRQGAAEFAEGWCIRIYDERSSENERRRYGQQGRQENDPAADRPIHI